MEAVVEYDYDAVHPDELTLKEGEIINNIDMLVEGWWEGDLNGRRGMFPDNFVKVGEVVVSHKGWLKKNLTLLWRFIFGTEYIKQKVDLLILTKELITFHNNFIW